MLPIALRIEGKLGLVVGGGRVGLRKATALIDAGARVRLVCKEPQQALTGIEWITSAFAPGHLDGVAVACAAAPPEVNREVVRWARQRGIWVNCADPPDIGDFYFPAVVRRGDLVLTVATQGACPALSRKIRNRLENQFDEAFGLWVELLNEMRPYVRETIHDPRHRKRILRQLARHHWLDRLRRENVERVKVAMTEVVASYRPSA